MHPFTSLTLWALAACPRLSCPRRPFCRSIARRPFLPYCAKGHAAAGKICRLADVPLGAGLWLVHGGWLTEWLSGRRVRRSVGRMLLRSGCGFWRCFNLTVVDAVRPRAMFYPRLFASRLPPGVAYLFAGPLLVLSS